MLFAWNHSPILWIRFTELVPKGIAASNQFDTTLVEGVGNAKRDREEREMEGEGKRGRCWREGMPEHLHLEPFRTQSRERGTYLLFQLWVSSREVEKTIFQWNPSFLSSPPSREPERDIKEGKQGRSKVYRGRPNLMAWTILSQHQFGSIQTKPPGWGQLDNPCPWLTCLLPTSPFSLYDQSCENRLELPNMPLMWRIFCFVNIQAARNR